MIGRRIAYVTSMATGGLAGFNHKEIVEMLHLGVGVQLFVTKLRPGPYMAPEGVVCITWDLAHVALAQFRRILAQPVQYVRLLMEALRLRSIGDFLIAAYWAPRMQQQGCEWIHCHWGDHKLYISYYCSRLTGIPVSVTLHGYDLYANPNWAMFEHCLSHCAQIITISEYNRKLLISKYGELGRRVKVIRLFAAPDYPSLAEAERTHILIVGGFHYRKGYDVLLRALRKLDREDLHLWIVGYQGPVDVPGLVEELGLAPRVTVFGQISDEVLHVLYSYCDIFCMPSRHDASGIAEGLPVALMEAMSYGKPIVSTRHTGIPELVPDILVEENDVEGLAAGLERLADNASLRKAQGERNRRIVEADYGPENVRTLVNALQPRVA